MTIGVIASPIRYRSGRGYLFFKKRMHCFTSSPTYFLPSNYYICPYGIFIKTFRESGQRDVAIAGNRQANRFAIGAAFAQATQRTDWFFDPSADQDAGRPPVLQQLPQYF